jgi:hypothetical protein
MIPGENKEDVIQTGISFMRAITEAYGNDEGLKLWDIISETLDPDVRGQILFTMLTGNVSGRICVTRIEPYMQIIPAIKAVRAATGWGLKDAKDAVDALVSSKKPIYIECHQSKRSAIIHDLRNAGLII